RRAFGGGQRGRLRRRRRRSGRGGRRWSRRWRRRWGHRQGESEGAGRPVAVLGDGGPLDGVLAGHGRRHRLGDDRAVEGGLAAVDDVAGGVLDRHLWQDRQALGERERDRGRDGLHRGVGGRHAGLDRGVCERRDPWDENRDHGGEQERRYAYRLFHPRRIPNRIWTLG